MRSWWVMRSLVGIAALALLGCGAPAAHPGEVVRLPAGYLLDAKDMNAMCSSLGWCEDFRTPSAAAVVEFEKQLPSLLQRSGRAELAASIATSYLRQYWAVEGKQGLEVVGNFVCWSSAVYLPTLASDFERIPNRSLARTPVIIDDAGICRVSVTFPPTRPQDAVFVLN